LKKVIFIHEIDPEAAKYYGNLTLQPGLSFFENMALSSQHALDKLKLLLPDTLTNFDRSAWITQGNSCINLSLKMPDMELQLDMNSL